MTIYVPTRPSRSARLIAVRSQRGALLGYVGQTSAAPAPASTLLSPTEILDSLLVQGASMKGWNKSSDSFQQGTWKQVMRALQNNQLWFQPSGCTGVSTGGAKILNISATIAGTAGQAISSAAAGGAAATSAAAGTGAASSGSLFGLSIAGGPIAPILMGIAGALSIFGAIFAHHAAKVAEERKIVCAAVPAANTSIASIMAAVQNGTVTPQQGIASLQQLQQDFAQTVSPIIKSNCTNPNAACGWSFQLAAIVANLSQQWANLPSASSGSPIASLGGSLPWLLGAGAVLAVAAFFM